MLSTLGQVVKDTCIVGLLADALLPGKDKPLWPITWEQLSPLQALEFHKIQPDNMQNVTTPESALYHPADGARSISYHQERILLLLSLLVTARNYENDTFVPPAWLTAHPLTYNTCPSELMDKNKHNTAAGSGILGYLFYQAECRRAFVVFSGTANGCMSMIDMDYVQVPYSGLTNYQPDVVGHRGFYLAYLSIRTQLLELLHTYQKEGKLDQLVICGHSLGGGMSTVAAFDLAGLSPIHYSFAGPRVFNTTGSQVYNKILPYSTRVTNDSDIVPTMPMSVMPNGNSFNHTGKLKHFLHNMGNYSDNHSLAYLLHYQLVAIDSNI